MPELAAEPGSCVPVGLFGDDAGVFASQKVSNICQNTKNGTTHMQGTITDMTKQNTLRYNNMQGTPNTMSERYHKHTTQANKQTNTEITFHFSPSFHTGLGAALGLGGREKYYPGLSYSVYCHSVCTPDRRKNPCQLCIVYSCGI